MMRLWKETFHDTDRYIRLVFDAYFNPDNICVRYDGDRLVAALLGVPYDFRIPVEETSPSVKLKQVAESHSEVLDMRGLYLCGLATRPEYRKQGIMSDMMEEIQDSAANRGFDFTFLIPADDHLREYYRLRGYRDFSRRMDFKINDNASPDGFKAKLAEGEWHPDLIRNLFRHDDTILVRKLAEWCVAHEMETHMPRMLHSVDDMITVMAENENAIYFTGSTSGKEYRNLANLIAVAFPGDISDGVVTEEMLKANPLLPLEWGYRKIFTSSLPDDVAVAIDLGPYAMARPLSRNATDELLSSQPVSVSLLLD